MPKLRLTKAKIEALESRFKTQKALAEWAGVSTRSIRYWKTRERTPTLSHREKIVTEYRQAVKDTGLSEPSARQVTSFYERKRGIVAKGIKEIEILGRDEDTIPKFSVSSGIPTKRYNIFGDFEIYKMKFKYGGVVTERPDNRIISLAVGIWTPIEFKSDIVRITEDAIDMASFYGEVLSVSFFRGKHPV